MARSYEAMQAEPQRLMRAHLHRTPKALALVGMGLGKSGATLAYLNDLFLSGESIAALVVAPMRVANITWPNEVRDWEEFSWMRIANLRTESGQRDFLQGRAHIYTINYESLHKLAELVERRKGVLPYDLEVWDEITKAKNPGSKRINLFRRKVPRTHRRVGLTGTFMPNSEADVFGQTRLIDDGQRLGTSFSAFQKQHFYASGFGFSQWKPKQGTKEFIEKSISDLTITLKTSDWLDLPDTIVEDVEISFTPELHEKYDTLEKDLILELKQGKTLNVANAAALVTKLLQFTSGHIYDEEREIHDVHDLKFCELEKIAKREKVPLLVACIYQHEQQRIRRQFPQARFFDDAKTPEKQKDLIREWNEGKIPMLVGHPASCSHGLNMQYGSNVLVYMTLTYSRECYEQMIARLARRGQTEAVRVIRLMIPSTVDDAVAEALATKSENEARLISALQMLESFRNQ